MTPLRKSTYETLLYLNEAVANLWAQNMARVPLGNNEVEELKHMASFCFHRLNLMTVPGSHMATNCVLANLVNRKHWLQDFANVVAPVIVNHFGEFFKEPEPVQSMAPDFKLIESLLR